MAGEKKDEAKDKEKTGGASAEGEAATEGQETAAPKSNKKMVIIIAVVLAVLVLGGATGAFMLLHKAGDEDKSKTQTSSSENGGGDKKQAVYYSLGDLLVNLSGEGKHPNFLKVKISLELADEKDLPLMDAIKPRIIDNFQVYLRELRIEDLRGSAGMYRLREELLMRVTEAAQPVRVRDVLFQEMLVQ